MISLRIFIDGESVGGRTKTFSSPGEAIEEGSSVLRKYKNHITIVVDIDGKVVYNSCNIQPCQEHRFTRCLDLNMATTP